MVFASASKYVKAKYITVTMDVYNRSCKTKKKNKRKRKVRKIWK